MKKCVLLALGLSVRAVAGPIDVGGLPAWKSADTEVATNVPFAFVRENAKHLLMALEFAGTPSNNVQVAFGRDANTNGVLEISETGLLVGWDCGQWVLRGGEIAGSQLTTCRAWSVHAQTTNRVKRLDFDLVVSFARAKRLVASENGAPLDWGLPPHVPKDLYDRSWDMLRLTVRGVDRTDETLRAQLKLASTLIQIR